MATQLRPNIWLLNLGEAGDAAEVKRLGIGVIIKPAVRGAYPHDPSVAILAVNIDREGGHPAWLLKPLVGLVAALLAQGRVIGIADEEGGLLMGLLVAAMHRAETGRVSFNTALNEVRAMLPPELRSSEQQLPGPILLQGQTIWP